MSRGSRQDTYSVTVAIDDVDTGIWDKMSGGGVDSAETKYKPGGLADQVSLGGSQETANLTISRLYDLDRDHNGLVKDLLAKAGKATAVVSKQPLDRDGVPFGDPIVYTGMLKACNPPEVDSESSDAGMLEIEVSTEGAIG
jgi:hypothetical protein